MKKIKHNINLAHLFADGRSLTDKEFMSQPFVVEYEKNKELYEEAQRVLDPNFAIREKERRRFERTEKRKAELEQEAARIKGELQSL